MSDIKIALVSDHAGYKLKEILKKKLQDDHYEVLDLGTHSEESVDYPDFALKMVEALKEKKADKAIAVCGTGAGMSMALNRHQGIRAVLVYSPYTAEMASKHNNANVLVLGGRTTASEVAKNYVDIFLHTAFEEGRHLRRLNKLDQE